MIVSSYKTIIQASEGNFKEKGSSFPAFCFPVKNEEEIKKYIAQVKKAHPKCNHHCYAFRLLPDGSNYRSSDDREPSGTAGKPILNVLLSNELTYTLIVVARYFGGSLLGVPGLIHAYRSAAEDAVKNATIITKTVDKQVTFKFSYLILNDVMQFLKHYTFRIIQQDFSEDVQMKMELPVADLENLKIKLAAVSLGYQIEIKETEQPGHSE